MQGVHPERKHLREAEEHSYSTTGVLLIVHLDSRCITPWFALGRFNRCSHSLGAPGSVACDNK